jgi:L-aminopeptidase/D-esterase-like protein
LLEITAPRGHKMAFAGDVIGNTTLVVVATDAALTKAQCTKLAAVAQNGLARALNPVHTMFDGDIVFGLSTGSAGAPDQVGFHRITVAGADVVTRAILRALLAAESTTTTTGSWPSWSDVAAGRSR